MNPALVDRLAEEAVAAKKVIREIHGLLKDLRQEKVELKSLITEIRAEAERQRENCEQFFVDLVVEEMKGINDAKAKMVDHFETWFNQGVEHFRDQMTYHCEQAAAIVDRLEAIEIGWIKGPPPAHATSSRDS